MTTTQIHNLASMMVTKMAIINSETKYGYGQHGENWRERPFYSEWIGMTHALKAMQIDFEIHFDKDVKYMTAIEIDGIKFAVPQ